MRHALPIALCCVLAATAAAQSVYNTTPDWISSDTPVSTGAALVDLDRDGWLDLVVSNGNDMRQERVAVYYNQGDGTFPPTPDWQSNDILYNGHLDVADVNGDGWPDVAVAHLGTGGTFSAIARVFLNNAGTLSSLPDWSADVTGNAFGVAFGDMNNDGWPDLAVATGWSYSPQQYYHNYVYLNVGGALESTASWASDDTDHCMGAAWVDADDDGWLDLAFAGSLHRSRIYRNLGGTLETTASWQATDVSSPDMIMVTGGDVTGDDLPDIIFADNNQVGGGSGRFRQYDGQPDAMPESSASWTYYDGYCSAVALADVDADGDLDLATGAWWDRTRLFFNDGSGFGSSPDWSSGVTSVVEKIVFGDIDNNALHEASETFVGDGQRKLFYLSRRQIQQVDSIDIDGLDQDFDYTYSREHGWISVEQAPENYFEVRYTYSNRLDMAISNWDDGVGNYVYYNQLFCPGDLDGDDDTDQADLGILLADWGCTGGNCPGDVDGDGDTDQGDLGILLADWNCP